jgi:hypothetical protein
MISTILSKVSDGKEIISSLFYLLYVGKHTIIKAAANAAAALHNRT